MSTKQAKRVEAVIEIGNEWLKVARISHSARGGIRQVHLERHDGASASLAKAVASACKRLSLGKGTPVVASLPRQMVNVRFLELPSTEEQEIADMVDLQIGKQTPYSRDEIVSGYRVLGSRKKGYTSVMLVIVQQSVVRERFHVLEEAGLDVVAMSVSSEGLLNWFSRDGVKTAPKDTAVALLDVDSYFTEFSVIAGGVPVFTRSILEGANRLIGEFEKYSGGFFQEIERSLEIFRSETHGLTVGKIVLTGAAPNIKGLKENLGSKSGLPVETASGFGAGADAALARELNSPQYQVISLVSLVGMALSPGSLQVSLIPDAIRLRKSLVQKARSLTLLGVLVMLTLMSLSLLLMSKFYFGQAWLTKLEKARETTDKATLKVEAMKQMTAVIRERLDTRLSPLNLLREIHKVTGNAERFTSIDIEGREKIVLRGSARTRGDVRELVSSLEKSGFFRDVGDPSTTMNPDKTLKFEIICKPEKTR